MTDTKLPDLPPEINEQIGAISCANAHGPASARIIEKTAERMAHYMISTVIDPLREKFRIACEHIESADLQVTALRAENERLTKELLRELDGVVEREERFGRTLDALNAALNRAESAESSLAAAQEENTRLNNLVRRLASADGERPSVYSVEKVIVEDRSALAAANALIADLTAEDSTHESISGTHHYYYTIKETIDAAHPLALQAMREWKKGQG